MSLLEDLQSLDLSAIVNAGRVKEMQTMSGGRAVLVLADGTRLALSRRRREEVAKRLGL